MPLPHRRAQRPIEPRRPDPRRVDPRGVEVRRILVDGRNVQHALARGTGGGGRGPGALPTPVFIAQLKAAVPAGAKLELVLDGFASGGVTGHVGPGLDVSYTRNRTADEAIAERVQAAAQELGPIGIDAVLVVSDDREVGAAARRLGARVAGSAWLIERLRSGAHGGAVGGADRGAAGGTGGGTSVRTRAGTSLGHGRPPRAPRDRC